MAGTCSAALLWARVRRPLPPRRAPGRVSAVALRLVGRLRARGRPGGEAAAARPRKQKLAPPARPARPWCPRSARPSLPPPLASPPASCLRAPPPPRRLSAAVTCRLRTHWKSLPLCCRHVSGATGTLRRRPLSATPAPAVPTSSRKRQLRSRRGPGGPETGGHPAGTEHLPLQPPRGSLRAWNWGPSFRVHHRSFPPSSFGKS